MDTMTIPLKSCKHNSYEAQTPTFTMDTTMGSRAILLTGGITASLVKYTSTPLPLRTRYIYNLTLIEIIW